MSESPHAVDGWAQNVARSIVSEIPHAALGHWATDLSEVVAAMLQQQFVTPSSTPASSEVVELVMRGLPGYLPERATSRLRAKILGALLTAGALGKHLQPGAELGSRQNPVEAS